MVAARARELYDEQAKERQTANLKKGDEKPVVEKLPQRDQGKSRDQAGKAGRLKTVLSQVSSNDNFSAEPTEMPVTHLNKALSP